MEEIKVKKKIRISTDFRLLILLKYIYVGGADICFWWSVWNIADHLWPMDITKDGALSYVRGYMLIIGANLHYLFLRLVFNNICQKFYEHREKEIYPTCIVTKVEVINNKPLKFKFLKHFFQLFVYMLVVGFILVWRGLFGTFNHLVDFLHLKHGVNRVLTAVLCQLIVWITLAFTQKNNAINLCPTHKIYKYDELDELDGLFNLHVFNNFQSEENKNDNEKFLHNSTQTDNPEETNSICAIEKGTNISFAPLNHNFDMVQYAARKISGSFHRSSVTSASSEISRKLSQVSRKPTPSRKLSSKEKFQSRRNAPSSIPLSSIGRSRKLSRQEFFIENSFLQSESTNSRDEQHARDERQAPKITSTSFTTHNILTVIEEHNDGRKTSIETSNKNVITAIPEEVYENEFTDNRHMSGMDNFLFYRAQDVTCHEARISLGEETHYEPIEFENINFSEVFSDDQNVSVDPQHTNESFVQSLKRRSSSIVDSFHLREIYEDHSRRGTHCAIVTNNKGDAVMIDRKTCENCFLCRLIAVSAYCYTIHHRQIFLHIFGGMFWSTTWKLFDLATESLFTRTASDIPALALIAMMCHCVNHLVLFRMKEVASGIKWKTFYEFLCGIFTVCLWAPVWYIYDIVAIATGEKLIFQLVMNLISFGSLMLFRLSINTAL